MVDGLLLEIGAAVRNGVRIDGGIRASLSHGDKTLFRKHS